MGFFIRGAFVMIFTLFWFCGCMLYGILSQYSGTEGQQVSGTPLSVPETIAGSKQYRQMKGQHQVPVRVPLSILVSVAPFASFQLFSSLKISLGAAFSATWSGRKPTFPIDSRLSVSTGV
jgi:hypothetical protein